MHTVENPGGISNFCQNRRGGGVNAFWAKSKGGTPFLVLLHFFENFSGGWLSFVIPSPCVHLMLNAVSGSATVRYSLSMAVCLMLNKSFSLFFEMFASVEKCIRVLKIVRFLFAYLTI
jgi:hypothetical protein